MTNQRLKVGLFVLILGAVAIVSSVLGEGPEGSVGYVNLERIWAQALLPALDPPLQAETERLQAELDQLVEGKSEAERQALFEEYQGRLYARQQQLLDPMLLYVGEVIGQVAEAMGVTIVIDAQSVLWGGVDMTAAVLDAIDFGELQAMAEAVMAQPTTGSDLRLNLSF